MVKIAINGFGRIGRAAFKIALDTPGVEVAAINDMAPVETLAYLLRYDTVYGRYEKVVGVDGNNLIVAGRSYPVLSEKDPEKLPWRKMDIAIVLECTGKFTDRDGMEKHARAGARTVILSAPSKSEEIATVIYGANEPEKLPPLISCASCTTNSIAPVVEIIGRRIGIKKAIMTTLHAYTSTQLVVDGAHKTLRRGRAAAANFVPSTTGAAMATARALPQFKGKFDGIAVRAPVPIGSISDIVMITDRPTTVEEINGFFTEEAAGNRYRDVVAVSRDEIVSSDIIKDTHACVIDTTLTKVVDGDLVKVMAWYDNEWGYASQLMREVSRIARQLPAAAAV
ncbi:MAG: type I glyceraldehyde-3-phosphate dehydrogenase [Elusimicrobia bacterium RIFOXYA2_FULL_50_26]|nr:MAG: type I glyceraldehyde-3-phosphate dehydrogenase [Elusimicrobia bacterium RIFOXYA2_FULL_50_26]